MVKYKKVTNLTVSFCTARHSVVVSEKQRLKAEILLMNSKELILTT